MSKEETIINSSANPGVVYDNQKMSVKYNLSQPTPYFHTIFLQNPFYAINEEWWNENNVSSFTFGMNNIDYLSNGAFGVESFNSSYGVIYEKNPYYYAQDIVVVDSWILRIVSEASTASELFNSGYSTVANVDAASLEAITQDPESSRFIKPEYSSPISKMFIFNLNPGNEANPREYKNLGKTPTNVSDCDPVVYYSNANFRRAMYYGIDWTVKNELSGQPNTWTAGSFVPMNMGNYNDGIEQMDYLTFGNAQSYSQPISLTETIEFEVVAYTKEEKMDALTGDTIVPSQGAYFSAQVANYYWAKFLTDLTTSDLPHPTPNDPLELTYVSRNANTDATYKAFNVAVSDSSLDFANSIVINPITVPGSAYWSYYYGANDWDVMDVGWLPDFQDPWTYFYMFNEYDYNRYSNASGGWTYLEGTSQELYDAIGYDWHAEGVVDGLNEMTSTEINWYFQDSSLFNEYDLKTLYDDLMADGEIGGIPIIEDTNSDGIFDRFNAGNLFLLDSGSNNSTRYEIYLIMELTMKYGVPIIPMVNENYQSIASRLIFSQLSYTKTMDLTFSYDCNDGKKHDMPTCDDLLSYRFQ